MANIAVIGTNYVGLVTAACFAELGNQVVGIDIDPGKVERLGRGQLPIYEPGLEEIVVQNIKAGRLRFTLDYVEGLASAQFAFVCVGTPVGHRRRSRHDARSKPRPTASASTRRRNAR